MGTVPLASCGGQSPQTAPRLSHRRDCPHAPVVTEGTVPSEKHQRLAAFPDELGDPRDDVVATREQRVDLRA